VADYLTTDYFASAYFRHVSPGQGSRGAGGGYRDGDAYAAILEALKSSGEFARVAFTLGEAAPMVAADAEPLAVVRPGAWRELADTDPGTLVRLVAFEVTLAVREEDPVEGFGRLDRLGDLAQNALDGSTLGGGCEPGLTRLGRGGYDPRAPHPEHRLRLAGEFGYRVDRAAGRDTTP
jgi:hypothetical protein